jgi:NAD(P)-dependent dehydrogenase (short-subunit alcohol dehydrogenase family)
MDSCVVTGGARGIGRAIAERMVQRGYAVVVTDVDAEGARRTAAEIGAAVGLEQDVRDPASHRFVATTAADHGRLSAWFNNAGVGDDGRLGDLDDEQVRRLVEVNLLGCLWGMRAAFDAFGADGGDVVNTASLSGLGPVPGYAVYAATKAAVVSVTMSVAAEAPRGIRVRTRCVPTACRPRCSTPRTRRVWAPSWCTRAAGSSPSTRPRTPRSPCSAPGVWSGRCRRGAARSSAPRPSDRPWPAPPRRSSPRAGGG